MSANHEKAEKNYIKGTSVREIISFLTEEDKLRLDKLKSEVKLLDQKATQDMDKPIEIIITRKGERS
jgi:hypothetical protein